MPFIPILIYTLMKAEFRKMSSVESGVTLLHLMMLLKKRMLATTSYSRNNYPLGDAIHVEDHIQDYFNEEMATTIRRLYRDIW